MTTELEIQAAILLLKGGKATFWGWENSACYSIPTVSSFCGRSSQQETKSKSAWFDLPACSLEKWEKASKRARRCLEQKPSPSSFITHSQKRTESTRPNLGASETTPWSRPVTYSNLLPILKQRSKGTPSSIYIPHCLMTNLWRNEVFTREAKIILGDFDTMLQRIWGGSC